MSKHSLALFLYIFLIFNLKEVLAQDLSTNIMRRVDTTNQNLDKAEKQIKHGTPQYAKPRLKAARRHYKDLISDFSDSLDSSHPIMLKINNRITRIDSQLTEALIKAEAAPKTDKNETNLELAADALRSIKAADRKLIWVKLKGYKGARAKKDLEAAKMEYENIFKYQKGRYVPNHPEIIALKKRIDAAELLIQENSDK